MGYLPSDFKIITTKMENFEDYLDFLNEYFSKRAPMTCGLHVAPQEMTKYMGTLLEGFISSGTSTCAIYAPKNQIVGVSFTTILTRDNPVTFDKQIYGYSENFQKLIQVIAVMEERANLFQDPKINKILEIAVTAVNPEFSRNKLTYRMTEESEKLAKKLGCQLVTSQSTNKITQHIRKKMGFEKVLRVDYETLELNGRRVMDMSALNGSDCALVLKKYL